MSSATPTTPLSPSPHVQLLEHHYRQRSNSAAAALVTPQYQTIHELAASPESSPQPSPPSTLPTQPTTSALHLSEVVPLPPGWSSVRKANLRLPSEKRHIPTLQIDTSDTHVLRRGLYIACAVMYLSHLIGFDPDDETRDENGATLPLAATGVCIGSSSSTSTGVTSPPVPVEPVEEVKVPKIFQVSVVEGGITNQLYKCSLSTHPDEPVLVRIYGPRTELVIDRSKENDVVDVLSSTGGGPRIFGRFQNGRLESWLPGCSCTPAQMREPHISALIAGALSRLHTQPMPFDRQPVIATVLEKWSVIASEVAFPENEGKQKLLDTLDLPSIIAASREYISKTTESYYASTSTIVFAHNDLLSGNVMYDPSGDGSIALVDFEYGNYNPRGFDLANHFCECCGFDCDWSVFPSTRQQLWFIRNYLSAIHGIPSDAVELSECHSIYAETQCWLLAPHLFWCLWAVVQSRHSPIAFDYLGYAHQRWSGFNQMKEKCEGWIRKSKKEIEDMKEIQ